MRSFVRMWSADTYADTGAIMLSCWPFAGEHCRQCFRKPNLRELGVKDPISVDTEPSGSCDSKANCSTGTVRIFMMRHDSGCRKIGRTDYDLLYPGVSELRSPSEVALKLLKTMVERHFTRMDGLPGRLVRVSVSDHKFPLQYVRDSLAPPLVQCLGRRM